MIDISQKRFVHRSTSLRINYSPSIVYNRKLNHLQRTLLSITIYFNTKITEIITHCESVSCAVHLRM